MDGFRLVDTTVLKGKRVLCTMVGKKEEEAFLPPWQIKWLLGRGGGGGTFLPKRSPEYNYNVCFKVFHFNMTKLFLKLIIYLF